MELKRSEFLTSMITILEKLQQTCVARGEPLLASVLSIAKGEAEDAFRHAEELAALHAMREKMSSRTSWRAADQTRPGAQEADAGDEGDVVIANDYERDEEERLIDAMRSAQAESIAA